MKKNYWWTFGLSFALSAVCGYVYYQQNTGRFPAGNERDAYWRNFLNETVEDYANNSWNAAGVYQQLNSDTSWKEGDWRCLERLKNFAFTQMPANYRGSGQFRFGFEVSDSAYQAPRLNRVDYNLPERIVRDLNGSDAQFWAQKKWKAWDGLELPGEKWYALQYRSRTVLNPGGYPQSLNRVLVLRQVRQAQVEYDQWIQFTVSEPATTELNRTNISEAAPFDPVGTDQQRLVDFISVRLKDNDSRGKGFERDEETGRYIRPILSFRQYWRDERGFNPQDRLAAGAGADTCYSCHANGMRALSPHPTSVWNKKISSGSTLTQRQMLDLFNKTMESYGEMNWGEAIHPDWYGPPFGETMGCAVCHNNHRDGSVKGISRGAINWGFSAGHSQHKASVDASMPVNERGSNGFLRNLIRDVVAGTSNAQGGDGARRAHHAILKQSRSGNYPTQAQLLEVLKAQGQLSGDGYEHGVQAADYIKRTNDFYRQYLFDAAGGYSKAYRSDTRDWLLEACDQN